MNKLGVAVFVLAALLCVFQSVSMVERGSKGESDVGVFFRTAQLLGDGAGGEVYAQRDSVTGWPISIPPAGMALFQPFAMLGQMWGSVAWSVFNLVLAALGVLAVRRLVASGSYPWLSAMFLILASGSIQVGQFSVLFVVCWLWAILATRQSAAAVLWTLPAAVKLYPLLLLAAPFATTNKRASGKLVAWSLASLVVFAFVLPFLFYGARTWDLNVGFVNEIVLDPSGRVKWMQALGSTANQSLDALLIRYLSWYPKFHEQYALPTAKLDLDAVRLLGHAVRFAIIALTIVAVVRWRRAGLWSGSSETCPQSLHPSPPTVLHATLVQAALWSATLYAVMPETRARYAVYAFIAFVPLVAWARGKGWRGATLTVVLFALVMGLLPEPLEVLGVGYLGTLALWLTNLRLLKK